MYRDTSTGCRLRPDATRSRRMGTQTKNSSDKSCQITELGVNIPDVEDKSRHNDTLIQEINEGSNASQYVTTRLPKWFPSLGDQKTKT